MTDKQQLYRRLQQHLDKFPIGFPAAPSGADQELLRYLFDPTEAEIACALNLVGEPVEKIAPRLKDLGLSREELAARLTEMAGKGLINSYSRRSGGTFFHIAFLAIGIFEFQVERMTPEFFRLFKRYLDEAFRDELLRTRIPQLRTIPTEGSLLPDLVVESYDHIRHLVNEFPGEIAVAKCVCRIAHDSIDEPCRVTDERETCLIFGSAARRYIRLGWGRQIDKDEVFAILAKAEEEGPRGPALQHPEAVRHLSLLRLLLRGLKLGQAAGESGAVFRHQFPGGGRRGGVRRLRQVRAALPDGGGAHQR